MERLYHIRIKHEINKCIGNKNCLLYAPDYFSFSNKKAHLQNNYKKENAEYREISLNSIELKKLVKAAYLCPVGVISIYELENNKIIVDNSICSESAIEISAEENDKQDIVLDKNGYFLVKVNRKLDIIEVGLCKKRNIVAVKITGKNPENIYLTIIKNKLISRLDHAAYLGRELQKAYIALKKNIEYVQDDELKL
jgi:ferredoxin